MLKKKSKTIYLSNARRYKKPRNKGMIVGAVVGISLVVGVGIALLPNAYRITIDGKEIGAVAKKEYITAALQTVEVQLEQQYKTEVQIEEIDEIKKVRVPNKDLLDPNKLPSYLRESLGITLEFQELHIDGEKVAVIESKEVLEELKTELKKKYFDDETVRAEFTNDVSLKSIYATEKDLTTLDDLVDMCSKRQRRTITYEVQPQDSLWRISNKLGVTITDVLKANEGMTEKTPLKIGQEINVQVRVPLLGLNLIELPTQETPAEPTNP
ncbi:MAG: LysM peptidoglycan-binding domain-containing protein [Cellulosilyticaceae bacterium]